MKTMKSFRVKKLFHLAKKAPKAVPHYIIRNGYRGYKRKKTKIYHFLDVKASTAKGFLLSEPQAGTVVFYTKKIFLPNLYLHYEFRHLLCS